MKIPQISIIVPVYNVDSYLEQCIRSLMCQTLQSIEIICINDGSTDDSLQILEKIALEDQRIQVVNQHNHGLSAARNRGVELASGKWIMFVDSDDWIEQDTCEKVLGTAELNDVDVVLWSYVREYSNARSKPQYLLSEDRLFKGEDVLKLHARILGLVGEELRRPELFESFVIACAKLYKRQIIVENKIEFVDTKKIGTEDLLFNIYYFSYIKSAVYINRLFYHYRKQVQTSLTTMYKPNLSNCWKVLFSLIRNFIRTNQYEGHLQEAYNNRIALSIIGLGLNECSAPISFIGKWKKVNQIISADEYRNAVSHLSLKYFPIHWKLFFFAAKYKLSFVVLVLLFVIKKLR